MSSGYIKYQILHLTFQIGSEIHRFNIIATENEHDHGQTLRIIKHFLGYLQGGGYHIFLDSWYDSLDAAIMHKTLLFSVEETDLQQYSTNSWLNSF